jgi:hypothetical protein
MTPFCTWNSLSLEHQLPILPLGGGVGRTLSAGSTSLPPPVHLKPEEHPVPNWTKQLNRKLNQPMSEAVIPMGNMFFIFIGQREFPTSFKWYTPFLRRNKNLISGLQKPYLSHSLLHSFGRYMYQTVSPSHPSGFLSPISGSPKPLSSWDSKRCWLSNAMGRQLLDAGGSVIWSPSLPGPVPCHCLSQPGSHPQFWPWPPNLSPWISNSPLIPVWHW